MRRLVFFAGWSHAGKEPCRNKLTAPTWRRLSVCRVPTHRDALWCMSGGRPEGAGRRRHECLRHGAKQPNVKLFLRGPLGSGIMATEGCVRYLSLLLALWIPATAQVAPMLNLVVLEGEGATN